MLGNLPTAATRVALPFLLLALGGCNHLELMNPKGSIGAQEKDLILIALGLMLLVVIPVMVLTVVFA
jgi:cytochrome o ubiquinol oxidase subunit II